MVGPHVCIDQPLERVDRERHLLGDVQVLPQDEPRRRLQRAGQRVADQIRRQHVSTGVQVGRGARCPARNTRRRLGGLLAYEERQ